MLRAMDAAVAGLRAHQGKLDVLSNNIANVNTFGFKAQSYSFKDTLYHTTNSSAAGTLSATTEGVARTGGTNAAQYGYGSLTGSIATDFTSSTPSYVGGFNAAINGSGFFITNQQNLKGPVVIDTTKVDETTNLMKAASFSYTRVGQFNVDSNGMIVDANGNFIYGFRPDTYINPSVYGGGTTETDPKNLVALRAPSAKKILEKGYLDSSGKPTACEDDDFATLPAVQIKGVEIGNDGVVKAVVEQKVNNGGSDDVTKELYIVIGKVAIASFQNQEGLMKAGNNTFTTAASDNTGNVTASEPGVGATPTLMAGYLENSNVDLAKEFTDMITSQRGFQANSKVITVSDEILQELVNMKR